MLIGAVTDYGSHAKRAGGTNLYSPPAAAYSPGASDYTKTLTQAMTPAAPSAPKLSQFDFTQDPGYLQSQALGSQSVADALANASAARQQALINYGYADPLASLFGGDQNLVDSAKGNPFSYLSNLQHDYDTGSQQADQQYSQGRIGLLDSLNKQGLYYSSAGENALAEALKNYSTSQTEGARNYQAAQAQGASGLQSLLGQIDSGVGAAQQKALYDQQQAAYQAQIDALLQQLATGGTTDPTPTDPPPPTTDPGSGSLSPDDYWSLLGLARYGTPVAA